MGPYFETLHSQTEHDRFSNHKCFVMSHYHIFYDQ